MAAVDRFDREGAASATGASHIAVKDYPRALTEHEA
jgi:hypothetical protein